MQTYFERNLSARVVRRLDSMPAVAILGPRQCGKSTLAHRLLSERPESLYLDLESPQDLRKLNDPEAFFELNRGRLICIDEIQRAPELFPVLRSVIDKQKTNGQFLVLGSASPLLLKQSSESLAGRIAYLELSPFVLGEIKIERIHNLWLRGGFPRSYLAEDTEASFEWRLDFIRTFLERDIPAVAQGVTIKNVERLWQMCAHWSGQLLNSSKLASSLGVSSHTVSHYLDLLSQTFMLRLLPPWHSNLKKRLIKSPKLYLRDTGILHALLEIDTQNSLIGHPEYGASWESFALENILSQLPRGWRASFYRTSSGNEIDLILEKGVTRIAVEFKATTAPDVGKGFYLALEDVKPSQTWLICPCKDTYIYDSKRDIHVGNPLHLSEELISSHGSTRIEHG